MQHSQRSSVCQLVPSVCVSVYLFCSGDMEGQVDNALLNFSQLENFPSWYEKWGQKNLYFRVFKDKGEISSDDCLCRKFAADCLSPCMHSATCWVNALSWQSSVLTSVPAGLAAVTQAYNNDYLQPVPVNLRLPLAVKCVNININIIVTVGSSQQLQPVYPTLSQRIANSSLYYDCMPSTTQVTCWYVFSSSLCGVIIS